MVEPKGLDVAGAKSRNKNLQRDVRRLIVGGLCFLSSLLTPRRLGVFGEKLKLIVMQCCVCQTWIAPRVDPDDLERHVKGGVYVQHAFAGRDGKPYLTPAERELFLSGVCGDCWNLLLPSDKLAYS